VLIDELDVNVEIWWGYVDSINVIWRWCTT